MNARLLIAALATLALGLATRPASRILPEPLTSAAGDALWALLVFWGACLLRPRWSPRWVFLATVAFALFIECSQLYHAPWIDSLRRNRLLGLVLGWDFAWGDLVCYALGALVGFILRVSPRSPLRADLPRPADG